MAGRQASVWPVTQRNSERKLSEETPRRFTPPEPPPPRVRGRWYSRRQGDKLIIEKWPEQKSEKAKRTAAIMGEWSRLMNIAWKFVHPAIRAQYDEHSKSLVARSEERR